MQKNDPLVTEIGELEAIRLATAEFRSVSSTLVGPGDDAAAIALSGPSVVITTDTMVQGHDFDLNFSTGFDLGFKAVATNVADVVAMGPSRLLLSLR